MDLWAWLLDLTSEAPTRSPRHLLGLVEWLPAGGAYAASVLHATPAGQAAQEPGGPHRFYGRDVAWHQIADLWDLLAAVNTRKGKPPSYPRPQQRKKRRLLFDMFPRG